MSVLDDCGGKLGAFDKPSESTETNGCELTLFTNEASQHRCMFETGTVIYSLVSGEMRMRIGVKGIIKKLDCLSDVLFLPPRTVHQISRRSTFTAKRVLIGPNPSLVDLHVQQNVFGCRWYPLAQMDEKLLKTVHEWPEE